MLTRRENLLRVLRHERPAWIPVTGHCDPYNQPSHEGMDAGLRETLKKVEWCDESTVAYSRALGLDITDFLAPPVSCTRRQVAKEVRHEGADTLTIWHTPAGDLREVSRQTRDDGTSYVREHLVKGPEDLAALAALFEDEQWSHDEALAEKIRARRALIGDDGVVMVFMPGTPLGMMYRVYTSVEALAYLWADARDDLQSLLGVMERTYMEQFRIAAASAADILVGMDDTSTTVISPAMFGACNLALTDARADLCHAAGKHYFHHSCGLIRDLLPLYRRTRMDAVHAYTLPTVGNATIEGGRPVLGNRITMIVSFGMLSNIEWDPAAVRATVEQMYRDAGAGDHIMFGMAGFPHRTMAQNRFLADCCREFGGLPG
ncbi:MAG: hypothetical protein K8T26_17575 [Lentisphaerae bacterium]|nr:hypothetical protein [Lentisphaerota bacterium]